MERAIKPVVRILVGCCLLSASLGTVHAFSVLISPIEIALGQTRAMVSLIYSLSLIAITIGVLFGHLMYAKFAASSIFSIVTTLAATGLFLAGASQHILGHWIGFGVVFGFANGLGYGYSLQLAGQSWTEYPGRAMGAVTAAYAAGAMVASYVLDKVLGHFDFAASLYLYALGIMTIGAVAALSLRQTGVRYEIGETYKTETVLDRQLPIIPIWLAYFGAVSAGLLMIGHASALARLYGFEGPGWMAPLLLAVANLIGSLFGGYLIDRWNGRLVLGGLPILTAAGLLLIWLGWMLIGGLTLIGFAYGATIAAYPAAIKAVAGARNNARTYGQVFTAWGVAGLFGPWLAGRIFDASGDYQLVILIAAGCAVSSTIAVYFNRRLG